MAEINVAEGIFPGLPVDVFTASGTPGLRRLQVDVGQTGFFAGREFRAFKELTITATPLIVRVTVPATLDGIILQDMRMSCYQGSIAMRAYRMGTEGGSWTPVAVWPNNAIPDVPGYVGKVTIDEGGTLTSPTMQSDAVVAFANETGKSSTTSLVALPAERGLPPSVFYLQFSRLPGTTVDGLGVFSAVWEERPANGSV